MLLVTIVILVFILFSILLVIQSKLSMYKNPFYGLLIPVSILLSFFISLLLPDVKLTFDYATIYIIPLLLCIGEYYNTRKKIRTDA